MSKKHPTTREVFFNDLPVGAEQDALEAEFFQRVLLSNGTFKTTAANRLHDLNEFTLPYIRQITESPLKIMDIAASSGVSTVEWYENLRAHEISCDITATDIVVNASLLSIGSNFALTVDRDQNILHMDILGIGLIGRAKRIWKLPIWATRTVVLAIFRATAILGSKPKSQSITLLAKKFYENQSLRMVEDDLLNNDRPDFMNRFHVIRAANILNNAYFASDVIVRMLSHVRQRLKDGGIFIVCRTDQNGVNNSTIFRAAPDGRFVIVNRLGRGSEVEQLICPKT